MQNPVFLKFVCFVLKNVYLCDLKFQKNAN